VVRSCTRLLQVLPIECCFVDEDASLIQPDYFIYFMPPPRTWLKPRRRFGPTITTYEQWQTAGYDEHSILTPASPFP